MPIELRLPPDSKAWDGSPRTVGVELEFGGLHSRQAAEIVRDLYGGTVRERDPHRFEIAGTTFGDFAAEVDSHYAHPDEGDGDSGIARALKRETADIVGDVVELWMPTEIDAPPVPIDRLPELERLVERLRAAGAQGTQDRLRYAFALQFNPEVASLDAGYVLRVFQAFLLLSDWLRAVAAKDLSRRMTAFIDPFPRAYALRVLEPDYHPDWRDFTDDYLIFNPTRNRDLDLTPLLAHRDRARVESKIADKRIKPRPTFHYRTPDSRVDEPGWSLIGEWNRWVEVERLAADEQRLRSMSAAYREHFPDGSARDWVHRVEEWRNP